VVAVVVVVVVVVATARIMVGMGILFLMVVLDHYSPPYYNSHDSYTHNHGLIRLAPIHPFHPDSS